MPIKDKKPFNFSTFNFEETEAKLSKEKLNLWKFLVSILGFLLFKSWLIAPFLFGFWWFGEGLIGVLAGWVLLVASGSVFYFLFESKKEL